MKIPNSPLTGKPLRIVFEPQKEVYRGEEYRYVNISFRDDADGGTYTTTESDAIWFGQLTNQYRERHGIPYTDEIIDLRARHGLSAAKMSVVLGFGANQYRLYEDGEVPSESNGKMIRSAMNPMVFLDLVNSSRHELTEKEYAKIVARVKEVVEQSKTWQEDIREAKRLFMCDRGLANGFAPQSTARLKNVLLFVLGEMGETFQTKLNKVLFYIDFLSYRETGMAISGLAYDALEFGPVPQRWDRVYSAFDEVKSQLYLVQGQECLSLKAGEDADMGGFSAKELAVMNEVCSRLKGLNARAVSKLSHEEVAWKKYVGKSTPIPFEEAFALVGV